MSEEKSIVIDDDDVLHQFYADRTHFVVSFDSKLVEVKFLEDEVHFRLRKPGR